jgi:hypothetical protein
MINRSRKKERKSKTPKGKKQKGEPSYAMSQSA